MAIKVRVNLNLKKQLQDARSRSSREIKKNIVKEIDRNYSAGLSPVRGFTKFKQYRPAVAKKKGRKTPVTIKESGALRKSLKAVQKSRSRISIFFSGARNEKIAKFINFGTKNMDARPLLPAARGQQFKKRITNNFLKIVSRSLKQFGL